MKTTISFGKVDYNERGKRNHPVELELELKNYPDKPIFSVCGNVWLTNKSDIVMGGQCIDSIWKYFSDQLQNPALYKEIMELWEKYHLNDMVPGTPEQEAAVASWIAEGNKHDYDKICEHLKSVGLYEVPIEKDGYILPYKYGSAWLYNPIPEQDLQRIVTIIGENNERSE